MSRKLSPVTALLLTVPPLMWAGNAVVGRMVSTLVPPITLNFLRWAVAFFILLPLGAWVLRRSSGVLAAILVGFLLQRHVQGGKNLALFLQDDTGNVVPVHGVNGGCWQDGHWH